MGYRCANIGRTYVPASSRLERNISTGLTETPERRGMLATTTVEKHNISKNEAERSQRSSKLMRMTTVLSPEKYEQIGPTSATGTPVAKNVGYLDLTWDHEERRSAKRRRGDSPVTQKENEQLTEHRKMQAKLKTRLLKLEKEAQKFQQLIRDNTNTKKEIKEQSEKIRSTTSQIMTRELQAVLDEQECTRQFKEIVEVVEESKMVTLKISRGVQMVQRKTKDIGTQTELVEAYSSQTKISAKLSNTEQKRKYAEITDDLENGKSFSEVEKWLDVKWHTRQQK